MAGNRNMMWFGTRDLMQWIPCPQINSDFSEHGWSAGTTQYLNGGAFTRKSYTTHKEYNLQWPPVKGRDQLIPVTNYSSGLYGNGPIYFIDPMAMDKNVLPQFWASPMLAQYDAPILLGNKKPSVSPTAANNNGYPVQSARYDYTNTERQTVYIPIPPGYTAWVGAHGQSDGFGGVRVTPYLSKTLPASATAIALRPVADDVRVDTPFDGNTFVGIQIDLSLDGDAPVIDEGGSYLYPATDLYPSEDLVPVGPSWEPPDTRATYAVIAGIMVQILKTGRFPKKGGFVSGQGHSGCSFEAQPMVTSYSAALGDDGYIGMNAKLVETYGWR